MPSSLMRNYGEPSLEFVRGEGSFLYDSSNNKYLDFCMGIAVNSLGHCAPELVATLNEQASKLWHTSNLYRISAAEELAGRLTANSFADKVFFCNSGTEAIECGFKLMRRYHHARGNGERKRIIALSNAFHGRTLAPLAAAANPLHTEGFLHGDGGFDQVASGDIDALREMIGPETAGIVLEPIQGEGGICVLDVAYLKAVRALCDDHGLALLFDEVQCGVGRSGSLFAYQQLEVTPDILATAKGLGGGFPVGACLAKETFAESFVAGSHGSTFGGNPLAMAVANQVIATVANEDFLESVRNRSERLKSGLENLISKYPKHLAAITGMGLMLGLKCVIDCTVLLQALQDKQLLVVKSGGNMLRLLPRLNVSEAEIDQALDKIDQALATL